MRLMKINENLAPRLAKQKNDNNFTFLAIEQIQGSNKLDVLKKYGTKCIITDFANLLGVDFYNLNDEKLKIGHACWCWTKSAVGYNEVRVYCDLFEHIDWRYVYNCDGGIRPSISFSYIQSLSSNEVKNNNGILELEYGEYPQTIVSENLSKELEKLYLDERIKKTGKNYTVDCTYNFRAFPEKIYTEYEYNGKKYIRIIGENKTGRRVLSDGRTIQNGISYWVNVEPIEWLIDEKTNTALSKKLLLSGIPYDMKHNYNGKFNKTFIYKYMNKYFIKDIIPSKISLNRKCIAKKEEDIEELINKLESDLNQLKDGKYKENIINNINILIDEYNKSLDDLLVLESSYDIKIKIKEYVENINKNKQLIELNLETLEYLERLLNVLNNKECDIQDDLIKDLNKINNELLPLIDNELQEKYKKILVEMINNEIEEIDKNFNSILNNKIINKRILKSKDLIKISLRNNMQTILFNINKEITLKTDKKINKIMSNTVEKVLSNYEKNTMYKAYFELIKELYSELQENVDIDILNNIVLINENINEEQLKKMIEELYTLKSNLGKKKKYIKKIK